MIEIRVGELRQLFNAIDPSPFRERELDSGAEEFIVSWAREASRKQPLALLVHLDRAAGIPGESTVLRDAIHEFFRSRAERSRQQLRQLFKVGRISLGIGLTFLALAIGAGDLLEGVLDGRSGRLVRESLIIGGWVAMWRPIEIFLYSWWPVLAEIRLFERLAGMPVRIAYQGDPSSESWRRDWPAVPPSQHRPSA